LSDVIESSAMRRALEQLFSVPKNQMGLDRLLVEGLAPPEAPCRSSLDPLTAPHSNDPHR
jgi:hypothetical protein